MRLDGKVAVVTGASRGIGLAVASRLVAEGARVCVTARKPEALEEAAAGLGSPDRVLAVAGRAHDPDHRAETVARVLETFGRLDVLVNNAGINPVYGPLMGLDLAAGAKVFEVNVLAALGWVQQAHERWLGEHGGAVVNMASVSGLGASPGIGMYGVTKAALVNLTQQLAAELGPRVRVNAVAPAVVKTRFASVLYQDREDEVAAAYPMKRLGVPDDVAGAVAFLASDDASWVTGQTLVLDGGVTLSTS